MDSFPAFFPLAGRRVVIVGAGEFADGKAQLFEGSPAEVMRIPDDARALDAETYRGAALAFIGSTDDAFAEAAVRAARMAGVPVNAVDRPALCDFFTPALVDRGQVVAAVGTGGASPVLAQVLKQELEASIPEGAGRVAALLQDFRKAMQAAYPDMQARRAFVMGVLEGPAAKAAMDGHMEEARRLMAETLEKSPRP